MPPKKKEEEIDVSTLPPWFSKNVILLCAGSINRSQAIINEIKANSNKMVKFVTEAQIIEHAKVKQLYVDITTLTEKQKKQLKPETPTQLTNEVKAKSMASLLSQLNNANRIERKNKLDALNQPPPDPKKAPKKEAKKEEKQPEVPVIQKQYNKAFDSIYILQNYPSIVQDFKQLSKENQSINYVVILKPQLIYPQQQDEQQEQQQDQQNQEEEQGQQNKEEVPVKKVKQPKYPKQIFTEEDIQHNEQITNYVSLIRQAKKHVPVESELRNCLIKQIKIDINVDKEGEQLKAIPELVFQNLCELSLEKVAYDDWLKAKISKDFETQQVKEQEKNMNKVKFTTPLELLVNVATSVQKLIKQPQRTQQQTKEKQLRQIEDLFDYQEQQPFYPLEDHHQHYNENYWFAPRKKYFRQQKTIMQRLMLPGVDRTLMPQIPQKSYQRRRYEESTYTNFINGQFDDFERMQTINQFESLMETVQHSKYNFSNRVYEEYHDKQSITDTFTKMLLQDPEILTKYDDKTDSLYIAAFFKNPPGRVNHRKWVADWKTLPNFDNWFNYFKSNENNFKNSQFYNIDDTKLGRIVESIKETSPEDGSIVIQKVQQACDTKHADLKVIKNDTVFGLKNLDENKCQFWYTAYGHRITIAKQDSKFEIVITLFCGLVLIINEQGHVYQKKKTNSMKILPSGFTIVYDQLKPPKILHPNGGLTSTSQYFANSHGLGLVYPNNLKQIPTFKRTGSTHSVTRRQDQTIIIQQNKTKWIKFIDGTTYELNNGQIKIDKKGFAQGKINDNLVYTYEDVEVIGTNEGEQYSFTINFKDGSKIVVNQNQVVCHTSKNQQSEQGYYSVDFVEKQLVYVGKDNIKFRVQNIDNEKNNEQSEQNEQLQRHDNTQPRLFLLRNNNSAAQFFSQKQLKKYFSDKQYDPNTEIRTVQQPKSQLLQVISKIYPRPNVSPIIPSYPSNLDILPVPPPRNTHQNYKVSTLRILSKIPQISQQDRTKFKETLKKQAQWKAQSIKADNQFGYCQKDSQTLESQMQFAKKMIQRRKQAVKQYPYSQLKDKLLSELVQKVVLQEQNLFQQLNEQVNLSKQKTSLLEQKQQEQQNIPSQVQKVSTKFVPYTATRNYFETPQGAAALSLMPRQQLYPPEPIHPNYIQQNTLSQSLSRNIPHSSSFNQNSSRQNMTITQSPIYRQLNETQTNNINLTQNMTNNNMTNNNMTKVSTNRQSVIKPSVFTQQDIDEQRKAFEQEKSAYQKRALKRKDVDIYGKERVDKPVVPTLLRTQPVSEVNQKYILAESITEKKIKTSSMKNRMMINSSNLSQIRKEGPHNAMLKSMDMGNTLEQISEKRTKMIHSDMKDPLSRDILILPAEANFGVVKQNSLYEIKIDVKNQDVMVQRIAIKRPRTNMVKAFLSQMGPIPLGISKKVIVQLRTIPEMNGKFTDQFQIVSKHQIYKIPVSAHIVSQQTFTKMSIKEPKQSLLKIGVSELKIQSNIRTSRMQNTLGLELPKI